jgi:hypothetical protein
MNNYINEISILGLMNKNCELINDHCFYKTKNHSKVVVTKKYIPESNFESSIVNYMYIEDKPDFPCETMMEISSLINKTQLIDLKGKKWREIRETFNKIIKRDLKILNYNVISDHIDINEPLEMIEKWRYSEKGGLKYGWQEHAGIDKFIISKQINNPDIEFLFFYIDNQCVGYSCFSKKIEYDSETNYPIMSYLTRKCLNDYTRNLTLFIDYITFVKFSQRISGDNFIINWGCSSGGVFNYKTKKWPLYKLTPRYFWRSKIEQAK